MRVRHPADYRTLVWSLVLFPLLPAVAYVRPDWAPLLFVPALYLAYCSGVLVHNHNHCPVFEGRRANVAYSAWLSIFYGFPAFVWIPTHNQNHHRFVNAEGDVTRTTRLGSRNTLLVALAFPFASSYWQAGLLQRFVRSAWAKRGATLRLIALQGGSVLVAHGALLSLGVHLHGWAEGALTYALVLGIPSQFAPWSMMFTNYVQHVDCDPTSPSDHSRNFVSPTWNWFVFDAGYHTVHHDHPGTHWSRYRELHRLRAPSIDPALNQSTLFAYCFDAYVLKALRRGPRTRASSSPRATDRAAHV